MSNLSIAIPITESSLVGEARRAAVSLAGEAGLNETECGKVAIAVTEAATNIVRHAGGEGQIVLRRLQREREGGDGLEFLALDTGPGLENIDEALRDGFSRAGTAGEGLGAIRRLASVFDLYSQHGHGVALLARFFSTAERDTRPLPPAFGVVSLPKKGEVVCGDGWAIDYDHSGDEFQVRCIVADGLGHGPMAAEASGTALQVFEESAKEINSPRRVLELAHTALRGTRGAAAAIAFADLSPASISADTNIRFCGIGNIMGVLASPGETRSLVSYNGTIGDQVLRFQEFEYPGDSHTAILVLASDGLTTRWNLNQYPGIWGKHPALLAGILYRDFYRNRDDATVLVARLSPEQDRGTVL